MVGNKKIKNTTSKIYNNIKFKSLLEVMCYKTLSQAGFTPCYEKLKFVIWEGYKPTIPFYDRCSKNRKLKLNSKKLIDITYTPDFTFNYKDHLIIIEAKGLENDVFPIKKKLFRKWLESQNFKSIYFEVFSKSNLLEAIEIIKRLK